jgi:hypothetical protein
MTAFQGGFIIGLLMLILASLPPLILLLGRPAYLPAACDHV